MFYVCEHIILGKSFAAPLGVVRGQCFNTFFEALEGRSISIHEWLYIEGVFKIEWDNMWDVRNTINDHFTFRFMPVNSVPHDILTDRQSAFQERLANWNPDKKPNFKMVNRDPNQPRTGLFNKLAIQRANESESDYEFRIIDTCLKVFELIMKHNPPIKKSA